jgi:hypothetical protein
MGFMENQSLEKRRRRSRQEISEMLERYRQSGLSQAEFAAVEGISRVGLARHLSRERMLGAGQVQERGFIEVPALGELRRSSPGCAFRVVIGEAVVEIAPGFCRAETAWLLSTLAGMAGRA